MQLLSQVAGALFAGVLVLALGHLTGLPKSRMVAMIAVVPVAAASLLGLPGLYEAGANLIDQRDANAALTSEEARLEGGVNLGVDVAFFAWAKSHFREGETFYLVMGPSENSASIGQWGKFQLGPQLAVEDPRDADWLVFYEAGPSLLPTMNVPALDTYAPGFAVARVDRAG